MVSTTHKTSADLTLGTEAWLAVVRSYNLCDSVLASRLAKLGVRVGTHDVLMNLLKKPNLTQQELASHCFTAKSGVSMLISAMEKDGLVHRLSDAADTRIKRVSLTAAGEQLARETLKIQLEIVGAMTDSVDEATLANIKNIFLNVGDKLKAMTT
jgi:DNA-binding MarR family transcriptional regulator